MKTVVTGGAGFIGSHVVNKLIELGHEVVVIDDLSSGLSANVHEKAGFLKKDINEVTAEDLQGAEILFHQAALGSVPRSFEHPLLTHHANVNGTLQLLLSAREAMVKKFIFASSSSVHGHEGRLLSPYAASKAAAEMYASVFADKMTIVGLRYFNVFGPRQRSDIYGGVIARWVYSLLHGDEIVINGSPHIARDFTYVDNVVQANMLAADWTPKINKRPLLFADIGCEFPITLEQLHSSLRQLITTPAPTTIGSPREGDIPFSCANLGLAFEELGYEPGVSFIEGLSRTVAWYKENS